MTPPTLCAADDYVILTDAERESAGIRLSSTASNPVSPKDPQAGDRRLKQIGSPASVRIIESWEPPDAWLEWYEMAERTRAR